MGDLFYLIIFLVVINIVGRIFRSLQKSAGQQTLGTKPKAKPGEKSKDPFSVLADRLEKLGEATKQIEPKEEPLPHSYTETATEMPGPELASAEEPKDFSLETTVTPEAVFEQKPRPELHEESFPWQESEYGYRPPVRPVTPAPGPERGAPRSYRSGVVEMLSDSESVRNAVLLGTILGPCRAREGRYRSRGPR